LAEFNFVETYKKLYNQGYSPNRCS